MEPDRNASYRGRVATWDDVRRIASGLPESEERPGESPQWRVRDKLFAWDRPLRRSDLEALGAAAPQGDVLAVRVADVGVKEALVSDEPDVYFTTPHFDGYPAVLVRLAEITPSDLAELLTEAWLVRAPKRLAAQLLGTGEGPLDTTFEATLERSPAKGGWTYVVWPDAATYFGTKGRVKVSGTVDGQPFTSSFMPLGDGRHKLPVTASTRKAIAKDSGDPVTVHLRARLG